MATKNTNVNETKVEDLKEKEVPKMEEVTTETVVQEESKVRKIITYGLKGLALIATGVVGFILGRTTAGNNSEDDDECEKLESAEE